MAKKVTIVDYGLGNLFSVGKAFEHIGAKVEMTSDAQKIIDSDYLVLPGVGSFKVGMRELENSGVIEPIKTHANLGKPLLGICLGMQMMMEASEENGDCVGLSLIEGTVKKIPAKKVPHIGWAELKSERDWTKAGEEFYFVHSYHAVCTHKENLLAIAEYEGLDITAAITKDNILGYQFHPEKSRDAGLNLCRDFLSL